MEEGEYIVEKDNQLLEKQKENRAEEEVDRSLEDDASVSYTHLTLPTICSV